MRTTRNFWFLRITWIAGFVTGLSILALYSWLPGDGATGDLESFTSQGFRVQWLLQPHTGGLQADDLIVRAGGHTIDEWLGGAPRGPEWRTGGLVDYQVLRSGQPLTVQIHLVPTSLKSVLVRWAPQLLVALAFLVTGAFVSLRRPNELAARLLVIFCITMVLQYLGDAYNFQYPTLPWRWPFWYQLAYEHTLYGLGISTICFFAFVFPAQQPILRRHPRLVPAMLYLSFPIAIMGSMAISPSWSAALKNGNHAAWIVTMAQVGLAIVVGLRSSRTSRDPVARAQMRWILWCVSVGCMVLIPGYVLPLMITGRALIPHPVTMLFTALIPLALAVAILRYRLFDIEIIINRTLVYGALVVLLGGLYLFVVRLLTWVIQAVSPQGNDTLAIFVATLTIALAFAPLQQRVQGLIDRTFYRSKLDFQRLLPEMSEKLITSVDMEQLAELLTKRLPRQLQLSWATLALIDHKGDGFIRVDNDQNHPMLSADHPFAQYLRRTKQPVLRLLPPSDLPVEAQNFVDLHGIDLSIPLIVGSEQVGIYSLGPKLSGNGYSRDEIRLLLLLGRQAAIAAENARLYDATQKQLKEQTALREAGAIISSALDTETVVGRIAEAMGRAIDATSAYISRFEPETVLATVIAEYISPQACDAEQVSDLGASYPQVGGSEWIDRMQAGLYDVSQIDDPDISDLERAHMLEFGAKSVLYIPLIVKDHMVGYAELWESRRRRTFLPEEIALCQAIAQQAAIALEHARLYEKAQQEIAERILAEEQLQASLAEKEVLLKEIHHRVKNNLQVISSLLNVQSKYVNDEEILRMLQDSRHRVRSMALVHERLYQAEDLARVDFAKYVRSMASYLIRSYGAAGSVRLRVDVSDISLGVDTAIPCGLILNELISNSFKHAFPDQRPGQIDVRFRKRDGQLVLTVRDNGIGIPEAVDLQTTKTLGLRLVSTLVAQLEGSIELDSTHGTQFKIRFNSLAQQRERRGS